MQCEVFDLQDPLPPHFTTGAYDAVFTNAALHWCKRDLPAVIRNAYTLLRPGGRFVGEMGGFGNIAGEEFNGPFSPLEWLTFARA